MRRARRRVAVLAAAVAAIGIAAGTGCAGSQGSSFETVGIPEPEDRPGRAPLILGWAYEERSGWTVGRVRVDGDTMREWNDETEAPAVIYLRPGEHELRLYTAQLRDPEDRTSRPRRRYRTRPLQIAMEEGVAQLCTIRIEGDRRRRPNVRCQARELDVGGGEDEYDEYGDEYGDEDEGYDDEGDEGDEGPVATAPPAGTEGGGAEPAPPAGGGTDEGVPDPFASPAPTPPAPAPTPPIARPAPEPRPSPTPRPGATPRPLSLEERVERLERQLEELRRQVRDR